MFSEVKIAKFISLLSRGVSHRSFNILDTIEAIDPNFILSVYNEKPCIVASMYDRDCVQEIPRLIRKGCGIVPDGYEDDKYYVIVPGMDERQLTSAVMIYLLKRVSMMLISPIWRHDQSIWADSLHEFIMRASGSHAFGSTSTDTLLKELDSVGECDLTLPSVKLIHCHLNLMSELDSMRHKVEEKIRRLLPEGTVHIPITHAYYDSHAVLTIPEDASDDQIKTVGRLFHTDLIRGDNKLYGLGVLQDIKILEMLGPLME